MGRKCYMTVAKSYTGWLKEIPGSKHSEEIIHMLEYLGAWWRNDEIPWCGVFTAYCLKSSGYPIPKDWYRARAWATYGETSAPAYGAIAVFTRKGGGHVGFITAVDKAGNIKVLGGNQSNKVSEVWFDKNRILAIRKPQGENLASLAVDTSSATEFSKSEA